MKIIFISIAAFVLLLSCSEEKGSNPTQPKVAKNIWDTISVEVSDYIECRYIWGKEPFVIYDDSTYNYHEKYNKEKRSPFCDTIPYPTVDFSTHDVIWWNYQYDVFQERPIGILRKNDSLKKYEYISVLSTKYKDLPTSSTRHFHIVPKLQKDYSISFIKDTIGEPWKK